MVVRDPLNMHVLAWNITDWDYILKSKIHRVIAQQQFILNMRYKYVICYMLLQK